MNSFKALLLIAIAITTLAVSCKRDDDEASYETAQLEIRLADAPGSFDIVNVDIQLIAVKMIGGTEMVLTPNAPGQYNLLKLNNGKDSLLLDMTLPVGTLESIRLVFGGNNNVTIKGVKYNMNAPTIAEGMLPLDFDKTIKANNTYKVWIDMDAGRSVIKTGASSYKLVPVLKTYTFGTNGRIDGTVLPKAANATIYAVSGADTAVAIPSDSTGYFMFSGLAAGSYQLIAVADTAGFSPNTRTVNVNKGNLTSAGTISLVP
jgi:hypothetical protein